MRALYPWLLACCSFSVATAQDLPFQQITSDNGLSDNAITALLQDRDGYLWIGTESGLNRFDGRYVRAWHAKDGLGGEFVTALLQDRAGTIWAATAEGGLSCFNATGDRIASFPPRKRSLTTRPNCLFDLNDSILMIGAQKVPIIFLNKRTGRFTYWKGAGPITPAAAVDQPVVSGDWCHYITDLGDGRMAIGFLLQYQQLIVDRASGRQIGQAFHLEGLKDQTVVSALRVKRRLYGTGWQARLHMTDLRTGEATSWTMPDECSALALEDSLHLLVGTAAKGLLRVDLRNGGFEAFRHQIDEPRSLSDDRIRALLHDREGRTWVGTANGLNLYAPQRWWTQRVPLRASPGDQTPASITYSIAQLKNGTLAVCTDGGLFMGRPDGPFQHIPIRANGRKLRPTMVFEQGGTTWLGAEEGIFWWVPGSDQAGDWAEKLERRSPPAQDTLKAYGIPELFQVRSILSDSLFRRPFLVLGVRGYGIALLDLGNGRATYFADEAQLPASIGSNLVNKVVKGSDGKYWAGTSRGLYEWKLDRERPANDFRAFLAENPVAPLPSNDVLDLLADQRGVLWIAMRNGGLAAWNGHVMRNFPLPQAVGNTVDGLAMDRAGKLWCAMRGCFAVLDTAAGTWEVKPLQGLRGLPAMPAGTRILADGRIAFVSDDMIQLIDPAKQPGPMAPPLPYLARLEVNGTMVDGSAANTLKLDARDGPLQVAVSTLDLAPATPYLFTFQLEGVDPVPRIADATGSVVYASLPPGKYRLIAHTLASDGSLSAPVVVATINKAAPVWQRWWFYLAIAAATTALAYALLRYRYMQRLRLQQVRNRIASDLHDEVGSSLSAISIGSQLAASLSGHDPEQARRILVRMGETSSTSLHSIRDIVWAIDPKHDEGEALVVRMQRIARELLTDKGVDVSFLVTGGVEHIKLPMSARKDLLLLFKEAVHNCSKYADAGTVQVSLQRTGPVLRLSIKDDGKGFDPSLHPDGHGLAGMDRRARSLKAELLLKSAPGMGTLVGLEVDLTEIRD